MPGNHRGADIIKLVFAVNLRNIFGVDGFRPLEPSTTIGDALCQKTAGYFVTEELQESTVGSGGHSQCFLREHGLGEGGDPTPKPLVFAQ